MKRYGRVDVNVNCAGIATAERPFTTQKKELKTLDNFKMTIDVNLIGTYNMVRYAIKHIHENEKDDMQQKGVIVNVASIAAFEGQSGQVLPFLFRLSSSLGRLFRVKRRNSRHDSSTSSGLCPRWDPFHVHSTRHHQYPVVGYSSGQSRDFFIIIAFLRLSRSCRILCLIQIDWDTRKKSAP